MIRRRLISLLLCALLLTGYVIQAQAVDLSALGSLTVHILETNTKKGIPNAQVTIYQVAYVNADGFQLTYGFKDSGFNIDVIGDLSAYGNKTQAAILNAFVIKNAMKGTTLVTDSSGKVKFSAMPLGLYLVVETKSPADHDPIAPFLITIPQLVADEYVYEVDAAPKAGTSPYVPTTPPTTPTTPPGHLPQTGQLWWPVYLMAGMGTLLILYGWMRRRKQGNE